MDDLTKRAVAAGQSATALLGLYLENLEKDDFEPSLDEIMIALGVNDAENPVDVGELMLALVGISLSLMISIDPDNPRRILEQIAQSYAEAEL